MSTPLSYDARQTRFGYKAQSVWGTSETIASAAFKEPTVEPFTIDPDVQILDLPANHGSRNRVQQDTAHITLGSAAKFAVAGPVDLRDIDEFMYAHFHKVIEGATPTFTKTFTYFTVHPILTSNEGHFLTWVRRSPLTASSQSADSCIAPKLKITGDRDSFVKFETEWNALGTTVDTGSPAGTWTPSDGTYLLYFNDLTAATLSKGAALASPQAITLKSFDIESVYELDKVGYSATKGFESFAAKNRKGSFKVDLLRDATIEEAVASMKTGEMVELDLTFGTKASIHVTGKITGFEFSKDGVSYCSLSCDMFATYSAGTVGEPLTITITNSLNRSWPTS